MVTPLEDMEPPCEQKALVWNTSLKDIPEFNYPGWHLQSEILTTFGHNSREQTEMVWDESKRRMPVFFDTHAAK